MRQGLVVDLGNARYAGLVGKAQSPRTPCGMGIEGSFFSEVDQGVADFKRTQKFIDLVADEFLGNSV